MAATQANFRVESIGRAVVFSFLQTRINTASQIESIQKAVNAEISDGKECLVFDFRGVDFVSSSMIGLLADARQRLRTPEETGPKHISVFPDQAAAVAALDEHDGPAVQVALCSLAPQIQEVFSICGLIK